MIHIVGLRRTKDVEPAEFVQRVDVLFDPGRDAVLGEQLGNRAVLPFRGRAIVAPDVENKGVVEFTLLLDLRDDAARVVVGVRAKPAKTSMSRR